MAQLAGPALALSLIGTAGQTMANVQALQAQAEASEAEARSAEETAAGQERQFRRQARLALGKGRAIAAASGVDPSRGSPLFLELDSVKQAEIEALNIRRTGRLQAGSKRFEARLAKRQIPGAILGGLGQGGSILANFAARRA